MKALLAYVAVVVVCSGVFAVDAGPRDDRVTVTADWLDKAVPAPDFEKDLTAGALHFIELTGQAAITPGLGGIRRYMCYSQHAGAKVLDVGGDLITADTDLSLRARAFDYGEAYNTILVAYLDRFGLNDCAPTVDWDAAFDAVDTWAGNIGPRSRGTIALSRTALRVYLNEFDKAVPAARKVCSILQKHGLDRAFTIEASPREFINTQRENEQVYKFTCVPRQESHRSSQ